MIFKLIAISIIGVVVVLTLKSTKPEFAVFAAIATGVIMVIILLSTLQDVILAFDNLVKKSGIDEGVFSAVLKIIGIGYLTEYSASIATDAGCGSIAQKLQFGGKLTIFAMSISIVSALIDVVEQLVNLV
jgi:stage III sporulation protein AD